MGQIFCRLSSNWDFAVVTAAWLGWCSSAVLALKSLLLTFFSVPHLIKWSHYVWLTLKNEELYRASLKMEHPRVTQNFEQEICLFHLFIYSVSIYISMYICILVLHFVYTTSLCWLNFSIFCHRELFQLDLSDISPSFSFLFRVLSCFLAW